MTEVKPSVPHNVDNLISEDYAQRQGIQLKPLETKIDVLHGTEPEQKTSEPEIPDNSESKPDQNITSSETPNNLDEPSSRPQENAQNVDEYGNEIKKSPKELKYSQEEVDYLINQRVRERLARAKLDQQQPPPRQEPKPDQETDESWETQLESFIDKRLEQRTREQQERDWREKELSKQAEFESKFQQGMNKYHDFHATVGSQNITDAMMLATRNLNDPAAFLYTAAKHHADDLRRISKMDDVYAQVTEMGKLHERMLKGQSRLSKAPHVLSTTTSDMPAPPPKKEMSIEERIEAHAKAKRR